MNKKPKILIIEDDKNICDLLKINLELEGYEVFVSFNGKDGLKKIYQEKPDLVLLDLLLPGVDGWEICKQLRSDEQTKKIPIIIISVLTEDEGRKPEMGVVGYLVKPFDISILTDEIKKALRIDY